MEMYRPFRAAVLVLVAVTATLFGQQAPPPQGPDPQEQQQQQDDGQGPGVARISIISGEVSVRRGDSGEVVAAAVNAPLQVQDRLMTGPNSKAEIQFDFANFVRLGPGTEIRMSQLDDGRFQIQVPAGMITFRMLRDSDAQIEISTPNVAIHPLKRGAYRIAITPDGMTEIMIRSGEAEMYSQTGSEKIRQGQVALIRGGADNPEFQMMNQRGADDWDRWNDDRDRELQTSKSNQYVPRDVYGAEDLDHYGRWDNDPQYGNVWVPQASPDWAPYQNGRWAWEDYYGWTWVSYDPWGWAPYHWGSWYRRPGVGWCWFPGASFGRHPWRPAVVGFFGWGGRGGVGFGFGHVGWVPLAPYERFHAWYGRGIYAGYRNGGFGGHTTILGNANIYSTYRNARVGNGVTSMASERFGRAGVDGRTMIRASAQDIQRAGLVRGQLPVSPDRSSTRFADREVRGSNLPRTSDSTRFVSRNQPSQVSRVPFDQQQRGIENGVRQGNFRTPAANAAPAGTGWRSVNEPPRSNSMPNTGGFSNRSSVTPNGSQPSNSGGGWRRFDGTGNGTQNGAPSTNRGWSSPSSPRGSGGYGQQPVRINPQIVRERPQGSAPGNYGGSTAPRTYSTPRPSTGGYSAPRPAPSGGGYSAPRPAAPSGGSSPRPSGGGGGGGSSHSSGSQSRSSGSGRH